MAKACEAGGRQVWSAERLRRMVTARYGSESVIVLSNRQPFRHDRAQGGRTVVTRSSGGLVTALEPLVRACGGVWVAHGAGSADRDAVGAHDGVNVPPADPQYRLRRVWLNAYEERGYYHGFANEGLWPLCHRANVEAVFRASDFRTYSAVNARFADAVCEEAASDAPLVLVQDYHFALAPALIRRRVPQSTIVLFWHIPWPGAGVFDACLWKRPLLEGLLGSSIVGFQTPEDCDNFLDTVAASLDAQVDRRHQTVLYRGRLTTVRAYPVSVEWPCPHARSLSIQAARRSVREQLQLPAEMTLGVGVDRLDYTKGIEEKLLAVEQLLESRPELVDRFVFVQIAEPSRQCLPAYQHCRRRVLATADRINARFGAARFQPIVLLESHHEPADVYRFLRAADLCYVGSLHDGMNLVAKEFVSARDDERGVLVLSKFAGAARELTAALLVDPRQVEQSARALAVALNMSEGEQLHRMRAMRAVVAEFNTYRWAADMLADAMTSRSSLPFQQEQTQQAGRRHGWTVGRSNGLGIVPRLAVPHPAVGSAPKSDPDRSDPKPDEPIATSVA